MWIPGTDVHASGNPWNNSASELATGTSLEKSGKHRDVFPAEMRIHLLEPIEKRTLHLFVRQLEFRRIRRHVLGEIDQRLPVK